MLVVVPVRELVEGSVVEPFIDIVVYLRNVYAEQPSIAQHAQVRVVLNENTTFLHNSFSTAYDSTMLLWTTMLFWTTHCCRAGLLNAKHSVCKTIITMICMLSEV